MKRQRASKPLFTPLEQQGIFSLSSIFFFRMFGLFLVLPVFSALASDLEYATPLWVGLALGMYSLTQAVLQIPFGLWSDRIGRKPVIAFGLVLFIIGSVLGALADNIYMMTAARLLQGGGAISAAIFALIADLTRPEVRTRANAFLGMSIGLAFAIAFFMAPFIGSWFGLSGLFWIIAAVATISLVVLFTLCPTVPIVRPEKETSALALIQTVLQLNPLRTINLGAFICSMGLSTTFFLAPLTLREQGFEADSLWKVYLPMLGFGVLAMIPAAIIAEVKNRFREVMLVGALLLMLSFGLLGAGLYWNQLGLFIAALFVFFMGFNVFEPIFPSLVTRMTTPSTKGTASGVYNFSQFIGHFAGAVLAGWLYTQSLTLLLGTLVVITAWFFIKTLRFSNPEK